MYRYSLHLRYPNERTFEFDYESDHRLGEGYEFHVFGRKWQITGPTPPSRGRLVDPSRPALECRQIA